MFVEVGQEAIKPEHWVVNEVDATPLSDVPELDPVSLRLQELAEAIARVGFEEMPFTPIDPSKVFLGFDEQVAGGFFHPQTRGFDFRSNSMFVVVNPTAPVAVTSDQVVHSWLHDSIHVTTPRQLVVSPDGQLLWTRAGFVDRAYDANASGQSYGMRHLSVEKGQPGESIGRPYLGRLNEFCTEMYRLRIIKEIGALAYSDSLDGHMLHHDDTLLSDPKAATFWRDYIQTGLDFLSFWQERGLPASELQDAFITGMLTGDRSAINELLGSVVGENGFEKVFMSTTWAEHHSIEHDGAEPYAFNID